MRTRGRGFTKTRVREWLQKHFLLRLHMFFILGATFLAGLAATKLLLLGEVHVLALRYALAVCAAYLAFLALIRLWLAYIRRGGIDITPDGIDFTANAGGNAAEGIGGGGHFGGGGASGSWGDDVPAKAVSVKGGGGGSSFGFDLDLDGEGLLIVVILILLVASLFVIGIYLIYSAPAILSEAAFEAALAAALVKRAKKIHRPAWMGVVWRATVWPFAGVLALSVALGWAVQRRCPEAKRVRDAFPCRSDILRRHDQ